MLCNRHPGQRPFSTILILALILLLNIGQAEARYVTPKDCRDVSRVLTMLPIHITAYYGMKEVPLVENIQSDLDRALALLLADGQSRFAWNSLDFEEIVIECQLAWREEHILLFKTIQKRVRQLIPALKTIQARFPEMAPLEAGQWLGEGMSSMEILHWKKKGLTPFAARMAKMRQGKP